MPIEVRNFATMIRPLRNISSLKGVISDETRFLLNQLKNDSEDNFAVAECLKNEIMELFA